METLPLKGSRKSTASPGNHKYDSVQVSNPNLEQIIYWVAAN